MQQCGAFTAVDKGSRLAHDHRGAGFRAVADVSSQ